jgi:hypothetical protein
VTYMLLLLAWTRVPKWTARMVPQRHPSAKLVIDRPPTNKLICTQVQVQKSWSSPVRWNN